MFGATESQPYATRVLPVLVDSLLFGAMPIAPELARYVTASSLRILTAVCGCLSGDAITPNPPIA